MENQEIEKRIDQEVERRLSELAKDPVVIIKAYQKRLAEVEKENLALIPKAIFYDSVTESDDWMPMATAVKSITFAGKPIGRNKMFKILRDAGVLRSGEWNNNEPYQKHVDAGRFKIVETEFTSADGETMIGRKTVVSQKGLDYIIKLVNEVEQ